MTNIEGIEEYDLVEIVEVPESHKGIIDFGDTGIVLDIYDDENVEVEYGKPDGSYKWLLPINIRYLKLISKDPYGIHKQKFKERGI